MTKKSNLPIELIEKSILLIRDKRVMIDSDLAKLYGVETRVLNQAVKRNADRFPPNFMFQLTNEEKNKLITNCDQFRNLRHTKNLPYAFTEYGALMLANILKSKIAIKASIQVIEAFVRLRQMVKTHKDLEKKITNLENKYDKQFKAVFDTFRQLMNPVEKKIKKIGFSGKNK